MVYYSNEYDRQAKTYATICIHHKLHNNNENKIPVFPGMYMQWVTEYDIKTSQAYNYEKYDNNGPLTWYVKLRVLHAPGMPGPLTSLLSPHASRHVRHARAVMHVEIAYLRWLGKRSRHSRRMCKPQCYVSGKRPMGNVKTSYLIIMITWALDISLQSTKLKWTSWFVAFIVVGIMHVVTMMIISLIKMITIVIMINKMIVVIKLALIGMIWIPNLNLHFSMPTV